MGVRNSDPNSELVRTQNPKEPEKKQDSEMGRRKSKRKPPPKNRATEPLDTLFNCPFCNHEKSCEVKMEKTKNTGNIRCMVCMEDFQATINFLSEPIDVYNEWIDACEEANT